MMSLTIKNTRMKPKRYLINAKLVKLQIITVRNANEALYDIKRKEIINQMLGQSYKEKEEHKKKVNELMERLQ